MDEMLLAQTEGSTFRFTVPTAEPLPLLKRFLAWTQELRTGARHLTLVAVERDAPGDDGTADELDGLLRRTLRFAELVLPAEGHRWWVVAATERPEPSAIRQRIGAALADANRDRGERPLPLPRITALGTWSLAEGARAIVARLTAEHGRAPRHALLPDRAA